MAQHRQDHVARGAFYLARTVLIAVVLLAVGWFAFMMGLHASNIYILTSEGLNLRAKVILNGEGQTELLEYFTETFVQDDRPLYYDTYGTYTVDDYLYQLSVERVSVLPWSDHASLRVVEQVSVSGSIVQDYLAQGESAADHPIPEWTTGRYEIGLVKVAGRWYIERMTLVERDPELPPLRTPDFSLIEE